MTATSDDLDMSPPGPHYATMKDGTRVWVGGAIEELAHVREQLRIANVRISAARRVLTDRRADSPGKLIEHAIAALDYVPVKR